MYAVFTPSKDFTGEQATYEIKAQAGIHVSTAFITVKKVPSNTIAPSPTAYPTTAPFVTPTPTPAAATTSPYVYAIEPANTTITLGQTTNFVMKQGNSSGGSMWDVLSPTWSLPNGGGTIVTNGEYGKYGTFTPGITGTFIVKGTKGGYSATAYVVVHQASTTTSTTTQTDTSATATPTPAPASYNAKVVIPQAVTLKPGQTIQFMLFSVNPNGSKWVETAPSWQVVKGGGMISSNGVFTAGTLPGKYEGTIRGTAYGMNAYASVTIVGETLTTNLAAQASPIPAVTPPPSSPAYSQPASTEVFKYLNSRVDTCLKNSFSEGEYTRYFAIDGIHANLQELGAKLENAKQCMKLNQIPDLQPETEACLVKQLTQVRFNLIYSNQVSPTAEEQNKSNSCYTKPNLVTYQTNEQIDPSILQCLEVSVGSERYALIKEGKEKPTPDELQLGRSCFNLETNILKPPLVIQTSEEDTQCLKKVVGEAKYQAIIEGTIKPSEEEKEDAKACLLKTSESNQSFLPTPPEHVPFIPEAKDDVVVSQIVNLKTEETSALRLAGRAVPNSVVDIYLFSNPIVVSTKTDENGNWSYELSYHLPEGNHRAYTVVHHPEKGLVRSEVFPFGISYAFAAGNDEPEMFVATPAKENSFRLYLITGILVIFAAMGILVLIFRSKLSTIVTETVYRPQNKTTLYNQDGNEDTLFKDKGPIIFKN